MLANFDQAYIFGDSLSDTGNSLNFSGGAVPFAPYEPGRFSNGNIWVDNLLTDDLNINLNLFSTGFGINDSVNFAIGGALSNNENKSPIPIGLEQQVDAFNQLVDSQGSETSFEEDLFFLWVGANDYFDFIKDNPATPDVVETDFPERGRETINAVLEVVDINIGGAIRDIIDAGGENIVLFNLPDLDKNPLGQNLSRPDQRKLRRLTHLHNKNLDKLAAETEASNPDVNIIEIDINQFTDDVLANPGEFGLTNVTDNFTGVDFYTSVVETPGSGDPNQYFYWDSAHPSATVHNAISDLVSERLINEGLITEV